jgi:hypothetical protein
MGFRGGVNKAVPLRSFSRPWAVCPGLSKEFDSDSAQKCYLLPASHPPFLHWRGRRRGGRGRRISGFAIWPRSCPRHNQSYLQSATESGVRGPGASSCTGGAGLLEGARWAVHVQGKKIMMDIERSYGTGWEEGVGGERGGG